MVDFVIGVIVVGCIVCFKMLEVILVIFELLSMLVLKYFDNDVIKVVEGGVFEVMVLLE